MTDADRIAELEAVVSKMATHVRKSAPPDHPDHTKSDLEVLASWAAWYDKISNTINWNVESPAEAALLDAHSEGYFRGANKITELEEAVKVLAEGIVTREAEVSVLAACFGHPSQSEHFLLKDGNVFMGVHTRIVSAADYAVGSMPLAPRNYNPTARAAVENARRNR